MAEPETPGHAASAEKPAGSDLDDPNLGIEADATDVSLSVTENRLCTQPAEDGGCCSVGFRDGCGV